MIANPAMFTYILYRILATWKHCYNKFYIQVHFNKIIELELRHPGHIGHGHTDEDRNGAAFLD